jgi:hypothetical protein
MTSHVWERGNAQVTFCGLSYPLGEGHIGWGWSGKNFRRNLVQGGPPVTFLSLIDCPACSAELQDRDEKLPAVRDFENRQAANGDRYPGSTPPATATVPDDGGPYAGRPMTGTFLVEMHGDGHPTPLSTGIEADGPADLAAKAREHADRHGFTITGATYAGHPVPGFPGATDQQPAAAVRIPTPATKENTVNLDATGPDEIRAAFTQAGIDAGEKAEELGALAGVLSEAADRFEGLEMAASTVGHMRDASEAIAAAKAALDNAQEHLDAALSDFNAKDGAVADAAADAGNLASREVLVGG